MHYNESRGGLTGQAFSSSSNAFASFRSSVSKPSVNEQSTGSKQFAGLVALALIAPQPRHAHRWHSPRTWLPKQMVEAAGEYLAFGGFWRRATYSASSPAMR